MTLKAIHASLVAFMRHNESKMKAFVVYLVLCVAPFYSDGNPVSSNGHQCEEIQIDLCKSLPYNRTRLPNDFEQDTQSSVNRTLWDLAQRFNEVACSEDLVFFVCSLYLPICVENQEIKKPIHPCRSVCEKVRSDCKAAVQSITGLESPFKAFPEFECEKLEVYDKGICLTPRAFIHPTSEFYVHASLLIPYDKPITFKLNVPFIIFTCFYLIKQGIELFVRMPGQCITYRTVQHGPENNIF